MTWLSQLRHIVWPDPEDIDDPAKAVLDMRNDVRKLLEISQQTRDAVVNNTNALRGLTEQHNKDASAMERNEPRDPPVDITSLPPPSLN